MLTILQVICIIGILQILFFTLYLSRKNGKILNSLSSTAYIVEDDWVFTLNMVLAGILMAPYIIAILPGMLGFIGMLFLIGMILVGASPHYKRTHKVMHYIGGYLAGIATQVVVLYIFWPLLLFWTPFIVHHIFNKQRQDTFYSESICFILMGICLLFF